MTTTGEPTAAEAPAAPAPEPRWATAWTAVVAALAALWVWTRATGLSRSLWWDEAFTAHRYVRDGASTIFDPEAYLANNHVLFSLLTSWTSRVLGTGEVALRLWVVVPSAAATAGVVWLLWRRFGPMVAALALGLVTVSAFAAMGQTELRGYGVAMAVAAALLAITVTWPREPSWGPDVGAAVAGAAGMLTFPPVMMLYLSHAGVWLLTRRTARIRLVLLTAASGLVTALVLRPLLSTMLGGADRVGSRQGDPITWWSPVLAPLGLVGGPGLEPAVPGPEWLAFWLAAAVGALGVAVCVHRDRVLGLQVLAALGGTIVLLAPLGFHLRDRYLVFLLPAVVVAMAVGVAALVGGLRRPSASAAGIAALVVLALLAVPGVRAVQDETNVPRQNFAEAAEGVQAEDPAVVVAHRLHVGYAWYLGEDAVVVVDGQDALDEAFCAGPRPAVWIPDPDMEPGDPPACIDEAREERVPQRSGEGAMSWWILD